MRVDCPNIALHHLHDRHGIHHNWTGAGVHTSDRTTKSQMTPEQTGS